MWYHIIPTNYREKFFSCSHSIAFLWFILLDIFFWSLTWCSMRGFDYLSLSPLIDVQLFLLPMVPEYLGHMNEEFLQSLYLDVETLVIGYYIRFFLAATTNHHKLSSFRQCKIYCLTVLEIRVWNGTRCTKISVSAGPYFIRGSEGGSICLPFLDLAAACIPWLLAFSSIINASRVVSSNLSLTLSFYFCKNISSLNNSAASLFKGPMWLFGLTQIIQNYLPSSNL